MTSKADVPGGQSLFGRPQKRSLSLRGHRTSVTLEPVFWEALGRLAETRGLSVPALAAEIDAARMACPAAERPDSSLAGALRAELLRAALNREI